MIPVRQILQINEGDTFFSVLFINKYATFYLEQIDNINLDDDKHPIITSGFYCNMQDKIINSFNKEEFDSVDTLIRPVYVAFVDCKVTEQNLKLLIEQIQTDKPELFI